MDRTFTNFLAALRGVDVRVSVAETLDALETAELVGWQDRAMLKDALSMALAKTQEEKQAFEDCFDQFFRSDSFRGGQDREENGEQDGDTEKGASPEVPDHPLVQMVKDQDDAALAVAMQEAAREVGVENIKYFTQRGLYTQRILQAMGIEAVDSAISAMEREGGEGGGGGGAGKLREQRTRLFEQVRNFVEQQLSLLGRATSTDLREDRLRRTRLGNLDRRDQEQMKQLVQRICKRLIAIHSRRRKIKNRGQLDIRRTMRRNYGSDGVLFEIEWKKRKLDRPRVIAICDVSGSVAAVARFLLQFIYALHELLHDVRTFAFSGNLIETSQIFERKPVEEAVADVMNKVGYMSTDYGESLQIFRDGWLNTVDKKTTVVILGDGRSNYTDPKAEILKEIHGRAKRVLWLNPEVPPLWGTGDSEMRRYRPYCDLVRECSTLDHLERVIEDLLHIARQGV